MSQIKPIGNRILVQPEEEKVATGGIILPDNIDKDKPSRGVIVAVGEGVSLTVGTKIIFSKYNSDPLKVDDKEFLMVKEEDVFATYE